MFLRAVSHLQFDFSPYFLHIVPHFYSPRYSKIVFEINRLFLLPHCKNVGIDVFFFLKYMNVSCIKTIFALYNIGNI